MVSVEPAPLIVRLSVMSRSPALALSSKPTRVRVIGARRQGNRIGAGGRVGLHDRGAQCARAIGRSADSVRRVGVWKISGAIDREICSPRARYSKKKNAGSQESLQPTMMWAAPFADRAIAKLEATGFGFPVMGDIICGHSQGYCPESDARLRGNADAQIKRRARATRLAAADRECVSRLLPISCFFR
jgi:hypothetical protein